MPDTLDETIWFRLSPELHAKLKQFTSERNLTIDEYIHNAVRRDLRSAGQNIREGGKQQRRDRNE
jgi:hypothetical protein